MTGPMIVGDGLVPRYLRMLGEAERVATVLAAAEGVDEADADPSGMMRDGAGGWIVAPSVMLRIIAAARSDVAELDEAQACLDDPTTALAGDALRLPRLARRNAARAAIERHARAWLGEAGP